jgi:hypothetical protein
VRYCVDFERLLEVILQQNNSLAQRPNICLHRRLCGAFQPALHFLYFFTLVLRRCALFTRKNVGVLIDWVLTWILSRPPHELVYSFVSI